MGEYNGVDTDHPSIIRLVQNMTLMGKPLPEIMKRSGMPAEVIQAHQKAMPKEK